MSLVEAQTYREQGHSRADPAKYRPPAEVEAWKGKGPIVRYQGWLRESGIAPFDDAMQTIAPIDSAVTKGILKRQTAQKVELASFNVKHDTIVVPTKDVEWIGRIVWASQ